MSRKVKAIQLFFTNGIILFALVSLSGCTTNQNENQNTNENVNAFLGTWVGTLEMPMFGGESNASVSQITFTSDRAEVILTSENRTFSMDYTYTTNGDSLILTPTMIDRNGFPGGQSFNGTMPPNGTRPPGNWTWSPNGTQPPGNGTWPPNGTNPYNGTWPSNGTRPPGDNRPSMTVSFIYAVDEEARVLYLNNEQFTKVQ
jgi:ABC-type Fe3+-hydroxamate transport system substrate-binding protein